MKRGLVEDLRFRLRRLNERSFASLRMTGCFVALVLCATASFADYKDHYKEGMKAYDLKRWGEVIRRMQSAIAEKSQEGEQILLYGMRSEPYLPHFYLGVAKQKSGDCNGAVQAFTESERQGAVRKARVYRELQSLKAQCASSEPDPIPTPGPDPQLTPAIAEAEKAITDAEFSARAVTGLKSDRDVAELWKHDDSVGRRESQLLQSIETAKNQLNAARNERSVAAARRAAETAAAARTEGDSFRNELLSRKRDVAERNALLRDLAGRASDAEALVRKSENSPAASSAAENVRRVVRQIRGVGSPFAMSAAELRSLQNDLTSATARLRSILDVPIPSGPPAALVAAVGSYFRGDYAAAENLLQKIDFSDAVARAQGLLIRGAARYALYVVGGEKNTRLRDLALNDLRECRRLDGRARPDPRFFSPRFASFFNSAKP